MCRIRGYIQELMYCHAFAESKSSEGLSQEITVNTPELERLR